MSFHRLPFRGLLVAAGLAVAACAPVTAPSAAPAPDAGLPPIPRVDGSLEIRVVHPTPNTPRPASDSALVYGSVGTGSATLRINGETVEVEPNGAFLAFLPTPADGNYNLTAEGGRGSATASRSYRAQPTAAAEAARAPALVEFEEARVATVSGGGDTLQTGSDVAIGRTSPTGGDFRWFLPRGARVAATAQQGEMVRVQLDTATAWFPAASLSIGRETAPEERAPLQAATVTPATGWVDFRVPADGAPFHVQPGAESLVLTVYGRTPPEGEQQSGDDLLDAITWSDVGSARAQITLSQPLWGYKVFYDQGGDLVVRVRRPPTIDAGRPLAGIRVVVDPGHPPAGATGPTGLTEAEANLRISLRLAEVLRERGAEVVMTRTTDAPLVSSTDQAAELRARTQLAVDSDAHLFVSVHNNAFPEGVNPFRSHGTSTYHFHPFAEMLARYLNEEIVSETRIRDLGHRSGNLAVARPTWFPSALTESLFMPVPAQEAALRDEAFVDRLARAHVVGMERFLRSQAR